MPVEQRDAPSRQAFLIGLGALIIAIGILFLFTRLGTTNTRSDLAGVATASEIPAGNVEELRQQIQDRSQPKPVNNPTGGYQGFYVYHSGEDPLQGWKAYSIVIDPSQKECLAIWQPEEQHFAPRIQDDKQVFAEPCGDQTYGPNGEGLRQLNVRIEQDIVLVDINTVEQPQTSQT